MKTDPARQRAATRGRAKTGSEPEKTARRRAAALAGISPPSAGEISKPSWDEFNRELNTFENRQTTSVPEPSKVTKTAKPKPRA